MENLESFIGLIEDQVEQYRKEESQEINKMEKKVMFEERFECPHCKKRVKIERVRTVIQEPVKGEYKEYTKVEKDTQTKLKEDEG